MRLLKLFLSFIVISSAPHIEAPRLNFGKIAPEGIVDPSHAAASRRPTRTPRSTRDSDLALVNHLKKRNPDTTTIGYNKEEQAIIDAHTLESPARSSTTFSSMHSSRSSSPRLSPVKRADWAPTAPPAEPTTWTLPQPPPKSARAPLTASPHHRIAPPAFAAAGAGAGSGAGTSSNSLRSKTKLRKTTATEYAEVENKNRRYLEDLAQEKREIETNLLAADPGSKWHATLVGQNAEIDDIIKELTVKQRQNVRPMFIKEPITQTKHPFGISQTE